jgi:hypothetical protein
MENPEPSRQSLAKARERLMETKRYTSSVHAELEGYCLRALAGEDAQGGRRSGKNIPDSLRRVLGDATAQKVKKLWDAEKDEWERLTSRLQKEYSGNVLHRLKDAKSKEILGMLKPVKTALEKFQRQLPRARW